MKHKLGDFVRFVDEKMEGFVTRIINDDMIGVTGDDDFEIPVLASKVTSVHGYKPAGKEYARHDRVNHTKGEYHRVNKDGTISTTNSAESFFSLLKRGVYGSWHHVSREHLPKYANEFAFRWGTNKMTDGARMAHFAPFVSGKRLLYRQPAN